VETLYRVGVGVGYGDSGQPEYSNKEEMVEASRE
jgi:hypothetical protein